MKSALSIFFFLTAGIVCAQVNNINIKRVINFCDSTGADGVTLIYGNQVIASWRANDCDARFLHTASMVKSWTAVVMGILIDKGIIKSVDEKVCTYLPEWQDACRKDVTIKHLLSMTAGFNRRGGSTGILAQPNTHQYIYASQLDTLPGIRFGYSNECFQALGMIMEKATGLSVHDVFDKELFKPLRMDSTQLATDGAGHGIVHQAAEL